MRDAAAEQPLGEHRPAFTADAERRLMLLVEASGALLSSPDSADVLRTLLDIAKRVVDADAYAVWRERHGEWAIAAMDGLSERYSQTVLDGAGKFPDSLFTVDDVSAAPLLANRAQAYASEGIKSLLTAPLRINGEISGTVVFYFRTSHSFTDVETRLATALANLAAAALGTADLYARQEALRKEAEFAERRSRFLAEAGKLLSSSLDYETTLARVAALSVPDFADWASIDVLDEEGHVQRVVTYHRDPAKMKFADEFRRRFPTRDTDLTMVAIRTGQSVLIDDVSDAAIVDFASSPEHLAAMRQLAVTSVIAAPLIARGRCLGVLSFVSAESGRRFTQADLAFAEELAGRAANAVDHARLFAESQSVQQALRRSNDELRRANADLNQFAYSASHDLQEPLRIVSLYSQLAAKQYGDKLDAKGRQYLDYAAQGAQRMEMLVRDILAYTQAATIGDEPIDPVDSSAAVERAVENLDRAISKSGATVSSAALPRVAVKPVHLVQLFQNLIANAIKYRRDDAPRVEIDAVSDGALWRFSVKDNGIGIEEQYTRQVFGLFKRLHSAEEYPGTGIGLAICQKIVERYHGHIWVESQPGSGSTFYFTLPRVSDAAR